MGKKSVNKNNKKRSVDHSKNKIAEFIKGALRAVMWFIIGTAFGLYVVNWFVAILPGPKVMATVHGLRGNTPNTSGCIYYVFSIRSNEPIEYAYLKLQFSGKINNFKVGLPQQAHTATTGKVEMQVWEAGKDANGACTIVQAAINNSADVQASAAGNMIAIHTSKLAPQTSIMGMVATTEGQSSVKPIPMGIYTEGAYEYLKLGQTVRKTLSVSNMGITDAK